MTKIKIMGTEICTKEEFNNLKERVLRIERKLNINNIWKKPYNPNKIWIGKKKNVNTL